jgi:hypothetical protein
MTTVNVIVRALHDLGAAAWFGGSLMGAVRRGRVSCDLGNSGREPARIPQRWGRGSAIAAPIGAHIIAGIGLARASRRRVGTEAAGSNAIVKTALTVAALASTAYSSVLRAHLRSEMPVPVASGPEPGAGTPDRDAPLRQQLRVLQWLTPVLTGALVVLGAQQTAQPTDRPTDRQGDPQNGRRAVAPRLIDAAGRLRQT